MVLSEAVLSDVPSFVCRDAAVLSDVSQDVLKCAENNNLCFLILFLRSSTALDSINV